MVLATNSTNLSLDLQYLKDLEVLGVLFRRNHPPYDLSDILINLGSYSVCNHHSDIFHHTGVFRLHIGTSYILKRFDHNRSRP